MLHIRKFLFTIFLLPGLVQAQKEITLADIHQKGTFKSQTSPGFQTTELETLLDPADVKDKSGSLLPLSDFQLSADRRKALVFTDREYIYRRSSKARVYLHDLASKQTILIDSSKILHATFSPDGNKVAFVKENNLFVYDITSDAAKAITNDGKWNYIINGNCDWVYEEEFGFTKAFQWSPRGTFIAYYRFDETKVREYNMTLYDDLYNKDYRYKYPLAGEENSKVEIYIYELASGKYAKADYAPGDIYIPRIKWTQDDEALVIFWLNRHQDSLRLLLTSARTGGTKLLYEEGNRYFVELTDDWWFLKDGKSFLFTSDMNGYRHLYLYTLDGKTKTQLSRGANDIAAINGVDEANTRVYYTMAYPRPMDRNFFVTDYSKKKTQALTSGQWWHSIELNTNFTQFYTHRSDLNTPAVITLNDIVTDKKKNIGVRLVKTITENSSLKDKFREYQFGEAGFLKIPTSKGDSLNAFMLKPKNFEPSKKYPVLFCNYGGPGSQEVANKLHKYYLWYQLLAQKGFIVVGVDNTGTGFRGEEFRKKTYLQLGKFEIEDQIDAAKYIAGLPYVDRQNIGHWGWSYGGFMSSLAITKGADIFKAAVAVAPVTSWRYYDNIYTERYMRTPQENPAGYDNNSPINFTKLIKGKFLIIHGTGDDNVHFRNSIQMVKSMIRDNVRFESAYYPNKTHSISGLADNTSMHLWSTMTNWILENLGNENTQNPAKNGKGREE
jgi:dipeptidyl-peptidase 4